MALPCTNVSCKHINDTNISKNLYSHFTEPAPPNLALRDLFIAMALVNGFTAVIAFALNLLIVAMFATTRSLRTPRNILLLGLAISDAAVAITAQPVFCIHLYSYWYGTPELTHLTDELFFILFTTLSMVSFATLTMISADRYLAIRIHLRYSEVVTTRRYCICLVIIWIVSGILTFVRYIEVVVVYLPIIDIVIFISVTVLNIFFMIKIAFAVRRHASQIHAQRSALDMPKYKKSVNTMIYVMVVFFFCYIGYVIGLTILVVNQEWSELVSFVLVPANTIIMLNGVFNPFIYCLRASDIRKAAISFIIKMIGRCQCKT